MKKFFSILLLLFAFTTTANAQSLLINTTRFVGGDSSCGATVALNAIPTRDGGIFFTGYTTCLGGGDIPHTTYGWDNVVVGKLDSYLNLIFVKVYGGSKDDWGSGAVQTSDGGYAVLATTNSNDGDVTGNHGPGVGDLWLLKLDSLGNLLWEKCYGSVYDEQSVAIAITPDNGFIFFGVSNGHGDDVPTHYSGSQFDEDWFIVKTDSAGNKQWTKSLGGTNDENGYGSIIVADNAYYLVSSSASTDYDCTDTVWHPNVYTGNDYYVFNPKLSLGFKSDR